MFWNVAKKKETAEKPPLFSWCDDTGLLGSLIHRSDFQIVDIV